MNWNQALTKIRENIKVGDKIDSKSDFRTIKEIRYLPGGERVYHVWIGTTSYVKISEPMLHTLFEASLKNGGIYNGDIFRRHFPQEAFVHPCHVHVVGKMFERSNLMSKMNKRDYHML